MGYFDKVKGVGNAKAGRDVNYLREGSYIARIDKCWIKDDCRGGFDLAICEMTVLHRNNEESVNRVGESASWAISSTNDYFLPECLALVQAVTGEDVDGMSEEQKVEAMNLVFDSNNPLEGTIVEVEVIKKAKKKASDADIAAGRSDAFIDKVVFRGEVKPSRAAKLLTENEINRFYPDGKLDEMAKSEAPA